MEILADRIAANKGSWKGEHRIALSARSTVRLGY
jgi:hypothetical protein